MLATMKVIHCVSSGRTDERDEHMLHKYSLVGECLMGVELVYALFIMTLQTIYYNIKHKIE